MIAEEWKMVEEKMDSVFANVKLKIDGYEVTLCVARSKGLKLDIAVYVNGYIKTADVINDTEIRRKFYNRHVKSLLTAKDKKMLKGISKARRKEIEDDASYDWYEPYWQSFRSLKRHLIKNNSSIELAGSEKI